MKPTPACWLAGAQPGEESGEHCAYQESNQGDEEPTAEPRYARDGTDQQVVEPPTRLLGTHRCELSGANEGHQDGQDEEADAEHRVGTRSGSAKLREDLLDG